MGGTSSGRRLRQPNSRARAAVQAALDQIDRAKGGKAAVPADALEKERSAAAKSGGIVAKTAAKVATDVHTWNQFVEEQGVGLAEQRLSQQAPHRHFDWAEGVGQGLGECIGDGQEKHGDAHVDHADTGRAPRGRGGAARRRGLTHGIT